PSRMNESGYRLYTDEDFGRLQKILSLKYLGFSLEEIVSMTINDEVANIAHSLKLQKALIQKKIRHLTTMEQTLEDTSQILGNSGTVDWNNILNLIHITNMEHALVDQYKTAVNLSVRIELHRRFSHNPIPWFAWLASRMDIAGADRILEIGCGNGELWQQIAPELVEKKKVFLTDLSAGMVEDAAALLRKSGRDFFCYETADAQMLPYADHSFDLLIANHVLFYVKDIARALSEIARVMSTDGVFYCSAYGRAHMKEITELVQEFDPRITLSEVALYDCFGLENGQTMLERQFLSVEPILYDDYLLVDEAEPLLDYILSCHGNQREILSQRQLEFKHFLQQKIQSHHGIRITKMAGVFRCKGKRKNDIQKQ
ncbi:MAG: methyltransferase domain-containing protein, partial [Hungatella sp.]